MILQLKTTKNKKNNKTNNKSDHAESHGIIIQRK